MSKPVPVNPDALAEAAAGAMYPRDHAAQWMGMRIEEVRPGHARLSMTIENHMTNGHAVVHGGLTFALADTAMAYAANSYNVVSLVQTASITFLAPARAGQRLTAVAREQAKPGRSAVYDVIVTTDAGETVALFRGLGRQIGGSVIDGPGREG